MPQRLRLSSGRWEGRSLPVSVTAPSVVAGDNLMFIDMLLISLRMISYFLLFSLSVLLLPITLPCCVIGVLLLGGDGDEQQTT